MKNVEANEFGIIHVNAYCESCNWVSDVDGLDVGKIKAAAKNHTRETGHTTVVETGNSIEYRLANDS